MCVVNGWPADDFLQCTTSHEWLDNRCSRTHISTPPFAAAVFFVAGEDVGSPSNTRPESLTQTSPTTFNRPP